MSRPPKSLVRPTSSSPRRRPLRPVGSKGAHHELRTHCNCRAGRILLLADLRLPARGIDVRDDLPPDGVLAKVEGSEQRTSASSSDFRPGRISMLALNCLLLTGSIGLLFVAVAVLAYNLYAE